MLSLTSSKMLISVFKNSNNFLPNLKKIWSILYGEYIVYVFTFLKFQKNKLKWFQVLEMNEKFYLKVLNYSHILPLVSLYTIDIEIIL